MNPRPRIYLDHAATSWPKPEAVYRAVDRYQRELGAAAGRSGYAEADEASRLVASARQQVARLLGAADPRRIVFTLNGTDALNLAIHGLLSAGGHVVTTVVEHNSVLRPLSHLEGRGQVAVSRVGCSPEGVVFPEAVRQAFRPDTRLVVLAHASNVTGALQPVEEVGVMARQRGALVLVDAAQTLGHVPLDLRSLPIDLLAAPGHKGLLGPLGTGLLYVGPGVEARLDSLRQGGTGSRSEVDRQPEELPDKYEAGNLNVAGIAGLGEGVSWLLQRGLAEVRRHETRLTARLLDGLSSIPGVTVYGPDDPERQVGVVSIGMAGYDPQELAAMLDAAYRIQVRSGLHCAPLMHRALGTIDLGGTVRFSSGAVTTDAEIEAAVEAVREIAAAASAV